MAYDVKANWMQLDVASLSTNSGKAYENYKRLYREMKAAREAFEACMAKEAELPATEKLVFGYNFGKLSIAIVPNDKPAKTSTSKPANLSAFLAAQRAAGART